MSRNYDNWDRLVEAVLRREKDRQLAYCESLSTCYSADLSSRFSFDSAVEDADFNFNLFVGDVHLPPDIDEQMDESGPSNWDVGFQPFNDMMMSGIDKLMDGAEWSNWDDGFQPLNDMMPVMHDSFDSACWPMLERVDSFGSEEEVPGIEELQIIGDAKPGGNLILGCGYSVRGTTGCMVQWIRHYPDGTIQYIQGANRCDYVVTADDVDTFVSVECIPMDELGRQGDLVRSFANNGNKITGVMHDSVDSVGWPMLQRVDSFGSDDSFGSEEEVPGIEALQIIGDAKPGGNLLGCGYSVRGTSLCMFQWARHYPDGRIQYILGANRPDYVVTADDVDTFVCIECIPMDELGRQGDVVRSFANNGNKITCDGEMQEEIDGYISQGLATFKVLIRTEDSEKWEPATLLLRRSGFQVEVGKNTIISESYSKELLIKIPSGLSAQFFLTCSNGSSYPLSTNNDIRMRDTLVLTMRIFQTKEAGQNNGQNDPAAAIRIGKEVILQREHKKCAYCSFLYTT